MFLVAALLYRFFIVFFVFFVVVVYRFLRFLRGFCPWFPSVFDGAGCCCCCFTSLFLSLPVVLSFDCCRCCCSILFGASFCADDKDDDDDDNEDDEDDEDDDDALFCFLPSFFALSWFPSLPVVVVISSNFRLFFLLFLFCLALHTVKIVEAPEPGTGANAHFLNSSCAQLHPALFVTLPRARICRISRSRFNSLCRCSSCFFHTASFQVFM